MWQHLSYVAKLKQAEALLLDPGLAIGRLSRASRIQNERAIFKLNDGGEKSLLIDGLVPKFEIQ